MQHNKFHDIAYASGSPLVVAISFLIFINLTLNRLTIFESIFFYAFFGSTSVRNTILFYLVISQYSISSINSIMASMYTYVNALSEKGVCFDEVFFHIYLYASQTIKKLWPLQVQESSKSFLLPKSCSRREQ